MMVSTKREEPWHAKEGRTEFSILELPIGYDPMGAYNYELIFYHSYIAVATPVYQEVIPIDIMQFKGLSLLTFLLPLT